MSDDRDQKFMGRFAPERMQNHAHIKLSRGGEAAGNFL